MIAEHEKEKQHHSLCLGWANVFSWTQLRSTDLGYQVSWMFFCLNLLHAPALTNLHGCCLIAEVVLQILENVE